MPGLPDPCRRPEQRKNPAPIPLGAFSGARGGFQAHGQGDDNRPNRNGDGGFRRLRRANVRRRSGRRGTQRRAKFPPAPISLPPHQFQERRLWGFPGKPGAVPAPHGGRHAPEAGRRRGAGRPALRRRIGALGRIDAGRRRFSGPHADRAGGGGLPLHPNRRALLRPHDRSRDARAPGPCRPSGRRRARRHRRRAQWHRRRAQWHRRRAQ